MKFDFRQRVCIWPHELQAALFTNFAINYFAYPDILHFHNVLMCGTENTLLVWCYMYEIAIIEIFSIAIMLFVYTSSQSIFRPVQRCRIFKPALCANLAR